MAVKRNYRINLRNYGNPPAVMVSQYDENYDLVFEVYDGVVPATGLNAYTVKLVGRQPGNDPALKYEFTGTVSGIANNILSFTIDTTMTGRAGKGTAEIVILDTTNDVKFASFNLPVYVEKAAVPDDAIDADVERAQEIADEVQDIVDTAAAEVKGEAESWAVGQRDGEDVPSTDPTYHNNAKYYSEVAQDIADSIGIDATLSISGKAADAKKTGDEISSLKEDLSEVVHTTDELFNLTSTVYLTKWIHGTLSNVNGKTSSRTDRCRSSGYILGSDLSPNGKVKLTIASGFKVGTREYTDASSSNEYVGYESFDGSGWATGLVTFNVTANHAYRFILAKTDDSDLAPSQIGSTTLGYYSLQTTDLTLRKSGASADSKAVGDAIAPSTSSNNGTATILAAKYFTYTDGTAPVIDWYLLSDTNNRLYVSNDLKGKLYICDFPDAANYKFGIRQNGDIIAVYRNEFSDTGETYDSSLDNVRQNPIVMLKSENYTVKHEVDFGDSLKPTGWLENCGFCSMPNGDILFGEYTRMMVLWTSNLWRIKATDDITDSESWEVVKSFRVAENDTDDTYDETVIEHFHAVQVDQYTGIVYFGTGDTKKKSQIWWSDDGGDTWTQQSFVDPSNQQTVTSGEKLFRLLNFNFTKDNVYWSSDSATAHAILRCERAEGGGFDADSMTILATLSQLTGNPATYGTVLYEDLGLMVLMERCDATAASMLFRAYDLTDGQVKTITTINTTGGVNKYLGFRTEYTEFETEDGVIRIGYGSNSKYRNVNAICGNTGNMDWHYNINNLWCRIARKQDGSPMCRFGTYYI